MKKYVLTLLLFISALLPAVADSPLTSTSWWQYYENKDVVKSAREFGCNNEVLECLVNSNYTLDLRLAVVNALGWNINNQSNGALFLDYYREKYGEPSDVTSMPGETLCVLAYLLALDNYFDVDVALDVAALALEKSPRSRGVAMIHSLIKAQKLMDDDWSKIYPTVSKVAENQSLKRDFSDFAVEQIMEYINEYKEYAK